MAHSLPSVFPASHFVSPWSVPSAKDSFMKPSAPIDSSAYLKNLNRPTQGANKLGMMQQTSVLVPDSQHQGRPPWESSRSLSMDGGRGVKMLTGAPPYLSTPISAPYGVIGSNASTPITEPRRGESQHNIQIHRQPLSTSTPTMRSVAPARENTSQIPVAPLSAPPFQTSFFPLLGPPGARQSYFMPSDWAINHNGFLIPENARRLTAIALEVDKAELFKKTGSERQNGPAMGCRMCAIVPRIMLFPCEHSVCSECGSRFMAASGGMYCSCGELVSSMINLSVPRRWDLRSSYYIPLIQPQPRPPPGLSTPGAKHKDLSHPGSPITPQPRANPSGGQATPQQSTIPPQPGSQSMHDIHDLGMDAETAIENAPFVELGRHALAQNWCCVKISNIPYSVTGENIMEFLGKNAKVVPDDVGLSVHIIMDRSSGKTMDAFVEFTCPKDAYRCVTRKRGKILGSRHVLLDIVNQEELMKELFPRAKGVTWEGVIPSVLNGENGNTKADLVTKEELVLVVGHARTPHRSPFSRKCLQRPYESILSIVAKFPWFAIGVYTIHQRDIIFQALISTIDILKRQCKRGRTTPNLDTQLLKKLCRAGVFCTGFTNKQKREIVKIGEFGAEGLEKEVEDDIPGFDGMLALGRKRGIESRIVEFYGALKSLQHKVTSKSTSFSTTEKPTDPEKQAAISRLPSALIDELDEPGHLVQTPSTVVSLISPGPLSEADVETRSKYTLAQMAALEWAAVEEYIRAVLPARGRSREPLAGKLSNTGSKIAS